MSSVLVLQAMKADTLKRTASKAHPKGVIDVHAQENQALTSSLSGNAHLPCPALRALPFSAQ